MNTFTLLPSLAFLNPAQWSFQNFITATSLQIAVAGVAAAIFASQSFLAAGFVIMGASVTYLGITGARFDAMIKQMSGKIAEDVETIETHTITIEDLTKKLASQTLLLNTNHTKMEQAIIAFKQENIELKKAQIGWELERKNLQENNQTLNQTKTALETQIRALNENYKEIGSQVKQFLASRQELSQNIKDFQQGQAALREDDANLKTTVQAVSENLHEEIAEFGDQVELGKTALQQIVQFIKEHDKTKQEGIAEWEHTAHDLAEAEKKLKAQSEMIALEQKKIEKEREELTALAAHLEKTGADLVAEKTKTEEEILKLTALLQEMRLGRGIEATKDLLTNKRKQLDTAESMLTTKRRELQLLQEEISKAEVELEELMGRIQAAHNGRRY